MRMLKKKHLVMNKTKNKFKIKNKIKTKKLNKKMSTLNRQNIP